MLCRSEGDQLARELGVPMLHTSVKTDTNAITSFIEMITITLVIILITFPIIHNTILHPSPPPGEDGHKRGRSLPESRQRPPQQEQGPGRG